MEYPKNPKSKTIQKLYDELHDESKISGNTDFMAHIDAFSSLSEKYGSIKVSKALSNTV